MASYSVCRVDWKIAAPLLKNVREKVFICEWRIPKKIEFDRHDRNAYHVLICDDETQEPVATGRLLPSGEISRIAVLQPYRHDKLDRKVLSCLLAIANEIGLTEIFINSQLDAVDYFMNQGFHSIGAVFMEAGLPRQQMACVVTQNHAFKRCYLSH